jgi:site-specific recombinase XerD
MAYAEKHGDKLTGRWSGRVRVKGKVFHRTFDRRKDAEGYELYCKLQGEEPPTLTGGTSGVTFKEAAAAAKAAGGPNATWRLGRDTNIMSRLEYVTDFLGAHDIEAVDTGMLEQLVANLSKRRIKGRPITGATINRYLDAASAVLTYAVDRGWITAKPKVPRQKDSNARKETISVEGERAVLGHMIAQGLRNEALCIEWLAATGMRLGEMYKIGPEQIGNGTIQLWGDQTKNDEPRLVYVDPDLCRRMRALVASKALPNAYHLRQVFKGAAKACGQSEKLVLHSLRHTTATRLLAVGVDVRIAQQILGHKDIKTTLRYSHVSEGMKREAAEKLAALRGQSASESTVVPFDAGKKSA